MKAIRTLLAIALCLPVFAQNGLIRRGTVTDSSTPGGVNYTFTYETRLEPPTPAISGCCSGGAWTGSGEMHRLVMDHSRKVYFGYDLTVDTLPQKNTYRVTFRPLSVGLEKFGLDGTGFTKITLPGYPEPQTVRVGDSIALDLLTNPTTGQKIVEHIQFQDSPPQVHVAVSGSARDFSVEDAEFKLMEPRVIVNGAVLPPTVNFKGGISGAAAWIYIPNHGRYVLSLVPHPNLGLQKAGEIRGSSLKFSVGSDTIALECDVPIAPGRAPYNLYVRYDAGWLPKSENARNSFLMGSADSISVILQR